MLAAAVAADPGAGGGPRDLSAWAPARDATKPLTVDELTEEAKEYVRWHAARREANLRRKGRLKDEEGGAGGGEDAEEQLSWQAGETLMMVVEAVDETGAVPQHMFDTRSSAILDLINT